MCTEGVNVRKRKIFERKFIMGLCFTEYMFS